MNLKTKKITVAVLILFLSLIVLYCVGYSLGIKKERSSFSKYFSSGHRRHPVSKNNISRISDWMTFDYINRVFNLPDMYLQEALPTKASKYPFITIKQYSKETGIDTASLVQGVKNSVKTFLDNQQQK